MADLLILRPFLVDLAFLTGFIALVIIIILFLSTLVFKMHWGHIDPNLDRRGIFFIKIEGLRQFWS